MSIRRMLISAGSCSHKKLNSSPALAAVIIVTSIWLLLSHLRFIRNNPRLICPSEANMNSPLLNKSGIRVIPSVPGKRKYLHGENKQRGRVDELEEEFDPYLRECVDMVDSSNRAGTLMICIHDPSKDLMVSAHLKNKGSWEPENVAALSEAYRRFPDLVLVDLGCNLGVFTLHAAKLGMEVVAVDSMLASLRLLQRSLVLNGLSCQVTLLHNALYRKRQQMRVALDPTNIGGSRVAEILEFRRSKVKPSHLVDAICLDDLAPLLQGRSVFLKIDLEGSERAVLECADQFFQQVDVKVLLLEWMEYRHNEEDSGYIKEFLTRHRMVPTWQVELDREIDPSASNSWPDNVFWMKKE